MGRLATAFSGPWVCRLANGHKWVRVQTWIEEAYKCRRCGRRHYGPLPKKDVPLIDAGGPMGPV